MTDDMPEGYMDKLTDVLRNAPRSLDENKANDPPYHDVAPTPRTDEYSANPHWGWFPDDFTIAVLKGWRSFASQLERELAEAERKLGAECDAYTDLETKYSNVFHRVVAQAKANGFELMSNEFAKKESSARERGKLTSANTTQAGAISDKTPCAAGPDAVPAQDKANDPPEDPLYHDDPPEDREIMRLDFERSVYKRSDAEDLHAAVPTANERISLLIDQHTQAKSDVVVLTRRCAVYEALLREWLGIELDSMDEDYAPWLESFVARVNNALSGKRTP